MADTWPGARMGKMQRYLDTIAGANQLPALLRRVDEFGQREAAGRKDSDFLDPTERMRTLLRDLPGSEELLVTITTTKGRLPNEDSVEGARVRLAMAANLCFKDNRNAIKEGQVEPIQPVGKFLEAQILSRDPGIREREGVPRPEDIVEAEFSVVGPEGN